MASFPSFNADDFQGEITLDHVIPEASATFSPLPMDLRPELVAALARRGIGRLSTPTSPKPIPRSAGVATWSW